MGGPSLRSRGHGERCESLLGLPQHRAGSRLLGGSSIEEGNRDGDPRPCRFCAIRLALPVDPYRKLIERGGLRYRNGALSRLDFLLRYPNIKTPRHGPALDFFSGHIRFGGRVKVGGQFQFRTFDQSKKCGQGLARL